MNTTENELVVNNLGLVHACANKFRGRGVEYEDLFQAGCLGLVKASRKFDESRGFAFSTYAVYVILGEIKRIFRDGGTVKVGRTLRERSRNALKIKNELEIKLGREPYISELAQAMGTDNEEAAALLNVSLPVVSLTGCDGDGAENDIPVSSPEDELSDSIALEQIMNTLDDGDRKLIELRYFRNMTQSACAAELGTTQVQISRREKKILEFIRKKMNS